MCKSKKERCVNLAMLDKGQILSLLKKNKPFLEREMEVKRIGLFGSYARDEQTPESDIDIFVDVQEADYKKLLSILLFLEQQLGKRVDLICNGEHLRSSFLRTLERETIYA